jgi:prevent-host-death family protein
MTETYNVYEAKTHLSELLARAAKGEEFVIAKSGCPLAKLVPFTADDSKPVRVAGKFKGKISYTEDCFAPMTDDALKDWYGDDLPALGNSADTLK